MFTLYERREGEERNHVQIWLSWLLRFLFRFFREGIKRLPSYKYRERDVSSLLVSCGKVDRSSFEMDGRRGKLDRIDFIRDVNDYPILTRIYRIHLFERANFRKGVSSRRDDEKEPLTWLKVY